MSGFRDGVNKYFVMSASSLGGMDCDAFKDEKAVALNFIWRSVTYKKH